VSDEQTQQADDPSGPGWRDVGPDEVLQTGDMFWLLDHWEATQNVGTKSFRYGNGYRRRIEPEPQASPDDPSGENCRQALAAYAGRTISVCGHLSDYGDRIQESQQVSDEQTQQANDPSGPGWRDVEVGEVLQHGDMLKNNTGLWLRTTVPGRLAREGGGGTYRRRIEPEQVSDSEQETMDDLRQRLAECEVLLAEAERSGEQVNAELQQLREQVRDLTRQTQVDALELQQLRKELMTSQYLAEMSRRQVADEAGKVERLKEQVATLTQALKTERDGMIGNLRSQNRLGQEALAEALQTWLRPVLELVAEHPEDASPLAVAVLGFLPGIASRLIEE